MTVRHGAEIYEAKVLASDKRYDLALLKVSELEGKAAAFSTLPAIGLSQEVTVAGYPLASALSEAIKIGHGEISAVVGARAIDDDGEHSEGDMARVQFDAPIQPGNSGGPLLDSAGNVIGMTVATRTFSQNVNFAIRGSLLHAFLDMYNIPFQWQEPTAHPVSRERRAAIARDFTVEVQCWKLQ